MSTATSTSVDVRPSSDAASSHPPHIRKSKPLSDQEIKERSDRIANHPNSDKSIKFTGMAALDEAAPLVPYSYHPRPLGDNDVQIAISHCGICGTDIHQLEAGWGFSSFPMIPGHEIVGEVKSIGKAVTSLKVGDRVGVGGQALSCFKCRHCQNNFEQYCNGGNYIWTYNSAYEDGQFAFGGYQENIRVHERFTIKIPDALPSDAAAPLLCAGVTVYSPVKTYYRQGMTVGVVGIGGLGHLALMFAKGLGAKDVVAISTSNRKKADAEKMGATAFVDTSDKSSVDPWLSKIDLMIVTANADDMSLGGFIRFGKFDSRFVLVGLPNTPVNFTAFDIVPKRVSISGSLIGSPSEIAEMFQFCAEKNILPWIENYPLSKVNEALQHMKDGKAKYRVVLEIGK